MAERRLRVAYVDHCAQLSGAQIALLRLLDALDPRVEAHAVLAEDGPVADRHREKGRTVHVLALDEATRQFRGERIDGLGLDAKAVASTALYMARLVGLIRRIAPDVVHTNSLKAALYGPIAARLAGAPVIVQYRDRIAPDFLPPAACRLVRTAARVLPAGILGYADSLESLGPNRRPKWAVVDPVDPAFFDVRPRSAGGPLSLGPLRIGMVGRVVSWKGQHIFLDAFAQAFPTGDCRAVIVGSALLGDTSYQDSLHEQARRLGIADRVDFLGFRPDIPAELADLDVVVHASVIPEPFGQVVTEAMAAGVAVVAAGAGGPARTITPGVDGLLTPPCDAPALAAALRRLATDPATRRRLANAGRRRAMDFRGEVVAGRVLGAYESLMSARGQSGQAGTETPSRARPSRMLAASRSK